ncbi:MAG: hypothetical protein LBH35_04405, partial [Treponema sp.]|nr:hypothetical protein [Treponema sp.]
MNRVIVIIYFFLILVMNTLAAQVNNLYGRWVSFDNDQNSLVEFEFTEDKLTFIENGEILFKNSYVYTDSFIIYS